MNPLLPLITQLVVIVGAVAALIGYDATELVKQITEYGDKLWIILAAAMTFLNSVPATVAAIRRRAQGQEE